MWRDQAYLLDMPTAARDARDFAAGLTRDEYEASRLAQYAVSHALQIIGEAAARLSDDTRNSAVDVPWTQLIGLRNRLVHEYGRIDRDNPVGYAACRYSVTHRAARTIGSVGTKRVGAPCDRFSIRSSEGATELDLLDAYPYLAAVDIRAAVSYAADVVAREDVVASSLPS
jgi:uncharacterized protein with HEPN domain